MTSTKTQLPYDYYALNFCQPKGGTVYKTENLGEILRGDRIVNTPFDIKMQENVACKVLCNSIPNPMVWNEENSRMAIDMIKHDYYVHLIVDNLPGATKIVLFDPEETGYERGYKLGYMQGEEAYINNHLDFILSYHTENNKEMRVVGFEVEAHSIALTDINAIGGSAGCSMPDKYEPQRLNTKGE